MKCVWRGRKNERDKDREDNRRRKQEEEAATQAAERKDETGERRNKEEERTIPCAHDGTKMQSPGINEEETRSCWSKFSRRGWE